MDRWEYATFKIDVGGMFAQGNVSTDFLNEHLNRYGEQCWELISAFDTNSGHGGSRYIVVIMKRKKVAAS